MHFFQYSVKDCGYKWAKIYRYIEEKEKHSLCILFLFCFLVQLKFFFVCPGVGRSFPDVALDNVMQTGSKIFLSGEFKLINKYFIGEKIQILLCFIHRIRLFCIPQNVWVLQKSTFLRCSTWQRFSSWLWMASEVLLGGYSLKRRSVWDRGFCPIQAKYNLTLWATCHRNGRQGAEPFRQEHKKVMF